MTGVQTCALPIYRTAFLYVDTSEGGRTGYLVEYEDTDRIFREPREKYTQDYIRGAFS